MFISLAATVIVSINFSQRRPYIVNTLTEAQINTKIKTDAFLVDGFVQLDGNGTMVLPLNPVVIDNLVFKAQDSKFVSQRNICIKGQQYSNPFYGQGHRITWTSVTQTKISVVVDPVFIQNVTLASLYVTTN